MKGPTPIADWVWTAVRSSFDRDLYPRGKYRVIKPFTDFDGTHHRVGEQWLLLLTGFNKFDCEFLLYVSFDEKQQWSIPLSGSSLVFERFPEYFERIEPLPAEFPQD